MSLNRKNGLLQQAGLGSDDALIVSRLPDIRWIVGFTGSSGAVLAHRGVFHLFTDGRYTEQAQAECLDCTIHIEAGSPLSYAVAFATQLGSPTIQLQEDDLTYDAVSKLIHDYPAIHFCAAKCDTSRLRAEKDSVEVDAIRRALRITEKTFEEVLPFIQEGVSETDLAMEIDFRQRRMGAERSSFDTIVAFGAHSALPHARPGSQRLANKTPILMDFGCVVDGYASDMTRVVHFGEPSAEFKRTFSWVEDALRASLGAARSGMAASELDEVARSVFRKKGSEHLFTHSLGHGVGLEIHEWPSVSSRNESLLPDSCVITIEPGLYLPGTFGIRLENMIQLSPAGSEVLNQLPFNLVAL